MEILKELELLIGKKIISKATLQYNTVGAVFAGDTIVGLGLANCGLTALPESILQLKDLQTLLLGGNQLTTLPESFGQLQSLQSVELLENKLTALPESLGLLDSLQKLSLGNNQLTTLPESFGNLKSPIVEV
jgi:Leucine-rich repeat (LRR) protein